MERQLADLQQKFRDQSVEYNAVKGELAQIKCQKEENQGPANVCQQKQDDLAVTIKVRQICCVILYCKPLCFLLVFSLKQWDMYRYASHYFSRTKQKCGWTYKQKQIKVPLLLLMDVGSLLYVLVSVFHPDWLIRSNF